jgi:hypothetical protein
MEHGLHEPSDAKESRRRDELSDDDIQHETEFDDTRRERIDSLPQGVAAKLPESTAKLSKTP